MIKIAFLLIATNNYLSLAETCAKSIKKFIKIPNAQIDCILFTNHHRKIINPNLFTEIYSIDATPWPIITLLRYHYFKRYETDLKDYDYIYYIDSDMEVVAPIGEEILGDRVATLHPGQTPLPSHLKTFERNPISKACIDDYSYNKYYFNSLYGGSKNEFLNMSNILKTWIDSDLKNNHIPLFHDESMNNAYYKEFPPTLELGPEFATVPKWNNCDKPKIVCLEKDHDSIRR